MLPHVCNALIAALLMVLVEAKEERMNIIEKRIVGMVILTNLGCCAISVVRDYIRA